MTAAVRPDAILGELHNLWITLGNDAEAEGKDGVLRACSMTLIVAMDEAEAPAPVGETIAEVMPEHPSRAIILRHRVSETVFLDAKVSAQCWVPLGQRRQICSEQIEITSSSASLVSVPGLVLPLLAPDLPVVVWCRCARLFDLPAFQQIAELSGKLIVDSAQLGAAGASLNKLREARSGRAIADLAWTRLTPWREAIAQLFESHVCQSGRDRLSELLVSYGGGAVPAVGWYIAAWLSSALRWTDASGRLRFDPDPRAKQGELNRLVLSGSGLTLRVARTGEQVLTADINGGVQRTFLPAARESRTIARELSVSGRDPVFERALEDACWIAGEAKV